MCSTRASTVEGQWVDRIVGLEGVRADIAVAKIIVITLENCCWDRDRGHPRYCGGFSKPTGEGAANSTCRAFRPPTSETVLTRIGLQCARR
jgi:hypothetical protein